ncbi:MFS transporter [Demequina capsici]|uniref:MFS transporter n=1 Tax=Demequina capsici TaxID=3075620 RepID=A0AA96F731_9MICO|nr:MFS transporter [Demequina sp. OYTSA14]WNM24338.1 MFS transporter [Demequina sp. OYTSA14]
MSTPPPRGSRAIGQPGTRWAPWRVVVMLGVTSLAADMVYEGARSLYGPLLASLGATAVVVGVVTGAGEAVALILRLVSGPLTDRTGRYWAVTIVGYALTVVSVPLLAFTPFLGAAGLAVASVLILLERVGKAVRSPAKSALLADAATRVGTGRGFGVHKALDQTGAFLGPLLVAAVVGATGALWWGPAALAVPGVVAMIVLFATRAHTPEPAHRAAVPEASLGGTPRLGAEAEQEHRSWFARAVGAGLPRVFFWYAAAAGLMTGGLVTFGLIGYHLVVSGLASDAAVPVIYAFGMLAEALGALVIGWFYDRIGTRVLYAVPVLVAIVPAVAMSGRLWVSIGGVLVWGLAFGIQDSTIKALVADVVEAPRRATAYGVFAAVQGVMAIGGGLMAGWLYDVSVTWLAIVVAATQLVAAVVLGVALRMVRRERATALS